MADEESLPSVMTAFPIISPSLHAPLGFGLRGEQERERRYKSKPIHMYICIYNRAIIAIILYSLVMVFAMLGYESAGPLLCY